MFDRWLPSMFTSCRLGEGSVHVTFEVTAKERDAQSLQALSLELECQELWEEELIIAGVTFRLCSEDQKSYFLEALAGSSLLPRITVLVKSSNER